MPCILNLKIIAAFSVYIIVNYTLYNIKQLIVIKYIHYGGKKVMGFTSNHQSLIMKCLVLVNIGQFTL